MMKKIRAAVSLLLGGTVLLSALPIVPLAEVSAASVCEIDLDTEYQTIDGFGGMNHPEWTGKDLTEAQRQKVFGNGNDELGFSILRIFVNPDSSQWNKAVPTAKYASEHGVTVFASPWEPPANLAESGGSSGKLHLPESNYAAYAEHLNNFGSYMKSQGVDLPLSGRLGQRMKQRNFLPIMPIGSRVQKLCRPNPFNMHRRMHHGWQTAVRSITPRS